jgi:hypothetical protein
MIGAMIYDTTLRKPVFWDGTAWRDAVGTVATLLDQIDHPEALPTDD